MRVTLVANLNLSGLHDNDHEPVVDILVPPLGLLSLASVLRESAISTRIVDFNYEIVQNGLPLDDEFIDRAASLILETAPDVAGFSTMCNSFHISLQIAKRVKERSANIVILLGGPQVSFVDHETLVRFPFVDYVLRGEAEESLLVFFQAISGRANLCEVNGLTFREDGKVVQNCPPKTVEQLDSLPFPAWDLFPYNVEGAYSIDVGRGCPFTCDFCSTSNFFQRRFRLKSFDKLVEEINWLQATYDAHGITFVHDLFTANRKWVQALCERLIAEQLKFVWSASARIDTVNEQLLNVMGQAGCMALFYGVETGSQELQNAMGKRLKIHTVLPVTEASLKAGIAPTLSFIAGFPNETLTDLESTFNLIASLLELPGTNVQLHLMSPQSGTKDLNLYHERLKFDGYISDIVSGSRSISFHPWLIKYPNLFPSFYYFENENIERNLLCGSDLFVRMVGAYMRYTISRLTSNGESLWSVYLSWRNWLESFSPDTDGPTSYATARAGSQYGAMLPEDTTHPTIINAKADGVFSPDEYLIQFSRFAEWFCLEKGIEFEADDSRDEIIAFYLQHYHKVEVRVPVAILDELAQRDYSAAIVAEEV